MIIIVPTPYFQLKASPGYWDLELREGPSTEIYKIDSHTGTSGQIDQTVKITLDSFITKVVRLQVSKKPGMENRDVLSPEKEDEESSDESIWSQVGSAIGLNKKKKKDAKPTETINIFSLASGMGSIF